jgi:hypothetical protein
MLATPCMRLGLLLTHTLEVSNSYPAVGSMEKKRDGLLYNRFTYIKMS